MSSWKTRFDKPKKFNTEESDALLAMLKSNRDKIVGELKDKAIEAGLTVTDAEIEEATDKLLKRDEDEPHTD